MIDFSAYTLGSTDFSLAKSAKKQKLLDTRLARAAAMQVNEILLSL